MALRILLTAMVVSLSLPLPSMDSCRLLVEGMNRELTTVLNDVGDEWSPDYPKSIELAITDELARISDAPATEPAITEEAFSKILDDFATESMGTDIAQASKHARQIPAEPVNHPLPPATEAIEVLPSALDLIRSVSEESAPRAVVSESVTWNDIAAERRTVPDAGEVRVEMVIPVVSADLGPWQTLADEDAADLRELETGIEAAPSTQVTANAVDSASEAWDQVVRQIAMADSMPELEFAAKAETEPANAKPATIQDAFRKTAEAIALWSRVMARPF